MNYYTVVLPAVVLPVVLPVVPAFLAGGAAGGAASGAAGGAATASGKRPVPRGGWPATQNFCAQNIADVYFNVEIKVRNALQVCYYNKHIMFNTNMLYDNNTDNNDDNRNNNDQRNIVQKLSRPGAAGRPRGMSARKSLLMFISMLKTNNIICCNVVIHIHIYVYI